MSKIPKKDHAAKHLGVLTSGGDCAGLNAAIYAITRHACLTHGWQVTGIENSTEGLRHQPPSTRSLTLTDVPTPVLRQGGTLLGTVSQGNPLAEDKSEAKQEARANAIIDGYHALGLDALICIGGDGSLQIFHELAQRSDLNIVGIPKTIDNDVAETDYAIGFATAVDVATEALERLETTGSSHRRVMILEVMGREAGHIALHAGLASGADVILMPEFDYDTPTLLKHIQARYDSNPGKSVLMIVAESVKTPKGETLEVHHGKGQQRYGGIGSLLAETIANETGLDARATVLGHLQRGGAPNARDRIIAQAFGVRAVDLVAAETFDRMVAWQDGQVVDIALDQAVRHAQSVDKNGSLIQLARGVGIYVGK